MEDVKIMENMKEVLKKTRKSRHKKSHSLKMSNCDDDSISEILNKKWMFSSPPSSGLNQADEEVLKKPNAFEIMMSKKTEPLVQIPPEMNGLKKRTYTKKPKCKSFDEDTEPHLYENYDARNTSNDNVLHKYFNKRTSSITPLMGDISNTDISEMEQKITPPNRKRSRVNNETPENTPLINNKLKRRKTKAVEKVVLDSNENSVETSSTIIIESDSEKPTFQSSRPKRACAGKVNYETLLSPEKEMLPEVKETKNQRRTREKSSRQADNSFEVLVIDEDSPPKANLPKKLAPVFMKKVPRPSIDPAVKEARRRFLLLGFPDDLRNSIDKQKQFEDEIVSNELIAFPSISHVTQFRSEDDYDIITECLWENSLVKIKPNEIECTVGNQRRFLKRGTLTDCSTNDIVPVLNEFKITEREEIVDVNNLVRAMKNDFGSFYTNRCYKQLYRKRERAKTEEVDSDYLSQVDSAINQDNSLFVDIFKPTSFDEFLVNQKPVQELRKFLLTWNEKRNSNDYDSDDSNFWESKGVNNYVVLTGLSGSGKTSSIYALANDLNYQVIEINAGSKRTGKKMLQDLSEATQSHRVKNKSGKSLSAQEETDGETCDVSNSAKSIILIEDAEIVFEADEGFASSIQQLINISKRPVILTTNNRNCQHLQKFIQHNEIMYQRPENVNHIAKYLSVLCLAANYQINVAATEHLYALNGHDLRKTINEIEFFIRSGVATSSDDNLMKFYKRPRYEWLQNGQRLSTELYGNRTLSSVCFESSIVSSFAMTSKSKRVSRDNEVSYQQRCLMDEMAEFFADKCNVLEIQPDLAHGKQKIIESSISADLISQSNSLSSGRELATDYSPMLRHICRSEKARFESGRRTANNRGHYLRFAIAQNSFRNDYFNEHCEMFQQ